MVFDWQASFSPSNKQTEIDQAVLSTNTVHQADRDRKDPFSLRNP